MCGADPRQRGRFNAAWTLGYIAAFAAAGAARIAVSAPAGPHGIADAAGPVPVFAVLCGLAALGGGVLHVVRADPPHRVAALLVAMPDRRELWLANTTDAPLTIRLPESFHVAGMTGSTVECDAYEVVTAVAA
jgi:hypothetical protein